jgi:hypothetical protein
MYVNPFGSFSDSTIRGTLLKSEQGRNMAVKLFSLGPDFLYDILF